jgi:hypothetical protein
VGFTLFEKYQNPKACATSMESRVTTGALKFVSVGFTFAPTQPNKNATAIATLKHNTKDFFRIFSSLIQFKG